MKKANKYLIGTLAVGAAGGALYVGSKIAKNYLEWKKNKKNFPFPVDTRFRKYIKSV